MPMHKQHLSILVIYQNAKIADKIKCMLRHGHLFHYEIDAIKYSNKKLNLQGYQPNIVFTEESIEQEIKAHFANNTPTVVLTQKEYEQDTTLSNLFSEYLPQKVICREVLEQIIHHLILESKLKRKLELAERKIQKRIEENNALNQALLYNESHDSVTQLINRQEFASVTSKHIDTNRQKKYAICLLDLSGFQKLNDTFGHEQGDIILCETAFRIQSACRAHDIVARFGGDEFIILLDNIDDFEHAKEISREIIEAVSKSYIIQDEIHFVQSRVGISVFPEHGEDIQTLMKNADHALFSAKQCSQTSVHFYDESLGKNIQKKLKITGQFNKALEQGEFYIEFQPQINVKQNELLGIEALLRWQHPQMGFIPPSLFIPIAEESGYINDIGNWVFTHACEQMKIWENANILNARMAINLSIKQFDNQSTLDRIIDYIEHSGVNPAHIELELTENIFIQDAQSVIAHLNELRATGVKIALDDFGTGYSCLSYLSQLPIDLIKIDRTFVSRIGSSHRNEGVIKAIISIAHNLGINVLAEGVETLEQKEFLLENQCDNMQGYLFSHPLKPNEVITKVAELGLLNTTKQHPSTTREQDNR